MKRLALVAAILLAYVVGVLSSSTIAQDNCTPCIQQAIVEQNMAFNQCRDNEGCDANGCQNCVGAGISAKYDYVNSSCPACGNLLIDGKK